MYPREITTTPLWIRHKLPLGPSPPRNGDEELRQQINSRNVISTNEMIEEYVRHERARLDLKWCLDQFFAWPLPNPFVGQLVVANISGFVHLAYIIGLTSVAISITPVDNFGDFIMIGYDDIYDATDSPFLENYLVNHHLLHPQQVLDYIANQDRKHELMQFSHNNPVNMDLVESVDEKFEITWPDGDETWFIHRELPQRNQFLPEKQSVMPIASTIHLVEESVQEMLVDGNCAVPPIIQQSNEIKLLLEQSQANYNALLEQNKLLKDEVTKQWISINELVLTMENITSTGILHAIMNRIPDLKAQSMKQLQFQPIDYLINCPPFLESHSPYVSNTIDNLYSESSDINVKIVSLALTPTSSNNSFNPRTTRSLSIGVMLIAFIFASMIAGHLGPYSFFYYDTTTSYSAGNLLFRGQNDFDWFRTLAVP